MYLRVYWRSDEDGRTLSSPPIIETPKCNYLLGSHQWERTEDYHKCSSTAKHIYIKRKPQWNFSRSKDAVYSIFIPPNGQPTNGKISKIAEVLPKDKGVWATHWAPQSGILCQEDEPLECLAFKTWRGGLLLGEPVGCGNLRLHSQRAHTKSHMYYMTQGRSSNLKSLGQTDLMILASWRSRRQLELTLGT